MTATEQDFEVLYEDERHIYWLRQGSTRIPVPGVSTILGETLPKDALTWWGFRVGLAGVVSMMRKVGWAEIANANEPPEIIDPDLLPPERSFFRTTGRDKSKARSLVEAWVVDNKLSTYHLAEDAADRGTAVHQALEAYAAGEVLSPREFPADQRGWVAGLNQWYIDQEPEVVQAEVMVGSWEERFAGRFDAVVVYPDGRRVLTDLKTSKGTYWSHLMQLALYRLGYLEMRLGDDFDALEVLNVRRDGSYRLVPSKFDEDTVRKQAQYYHALTANKLRHRDVPGLSEDMPTIHK